MATRRDQIWEERRRSRNRGVAHPPPKVVPVTGAPAGSQMLAEAPGARGSMATTETRTSLEDTTSLLREELARRADGGDDFGARGRGNKVDGRLSSSMLSEDSGGAGSADHPMFEDMVAAEMRKMERDFRQQLHDGPDNHKEREPSYQQRQQEQHRPPPPPASIYQPSPPRSLAPPDDTAVRLGLSPPPSSRRSLGFGRGLGNLYEASPVGEALGMGTGGKERQQRRGFGQGINSLYTSSDDATAARIKQQEYARALAEQVTAHGSSGRRRSGGVGNGDEATGLLWGSATSPPQQRRMLQAGAAHSGGRGQEDQRRTDEMELGRWRSATASAAQLSGAGRGVAGLAGPADRWGQEYPGLMIGSSAASLSPNRQRRRRVNPGLEHMFDDPEEKQHRRLDQREYARALEQQMAEKQQQNKQQREQASSRDQAPYTSPLPLPAAGLMFGSTSHDRVRTGHGLPASDSPSRRPISDAPSVYRAMMQATSPPARGGQRAPQNDIRGIMGGGGGVGVPQPSPAEKKAAYAAALRQQILENEERKRKEKEQLRQERGTSNTPLHPPNPPPAQAQGGYPPTEYTPSGYISSPDSATRWAERGEGAGTRRYLASEWTTDAAPPPSTTPRRALEFTPCTTTPSPSQPPVGMTEARRRLVRDVYGSNTSPWATMPAPPLPSPTQAAPGGSGVTFSATMPSPTRASLDAQGGAAGPMQPPSAIKASFAKHGALAYDPNVQQTLMAKHRAALEQREALERQMEEKRRVKESTLAKQKQEEEHEVRRMLEDSEKAAAEAESERRKKVEVEQKVQYDAQQDVRRRETLELRAELAHLQQQRAALDAMAGAPSVAGGEGSGVSPPAAARTPRITDDQLRVGRQAAEEPLQRASGAYATRDEAPTQSPVRERVEDEGELWGNLVGRSPGRRTSVFNTQQRPRGGARAREVQEPRNRTVPAGRRREADEAYDPLEQSLATDSRFISLHEDELLMGSGGEGGADEASLASSPLRHQHAGPSGNLPRQGPPVAGLSGGSPLSRSPYRRSVLHRSTVAGEEDEMDVFVEQWQRNHGLAALTRQQYQTGTQYRSRARGGYGQYGGERYRPGGSAAAIMAGGARRGGVEDSLSSDSTFMMLTEEEKARAEAEERRAREAYDEKGRASGPHEGGPQTTAEDLSGQELQGRGALGNEENRTVPHRLSSNQPAPLSPLTELLRNHSEIRADQHVLSGLRSSRADENENQTEATRPLSNGAARPQAARHSPPRSPAASRHAHAAGGALSPGEEYGGEGFEEEEDGEAGGAGRVLGDISGRLANVRVGGNGEGHEEKDKERGKWKVPSNEMERAKVLEAIL